MRIEKVKDFLDKNSFKYIVNDQKLTVSLDFAQKVTLDFSQQGKMKIKDQLTGWNFLTGMIPMSLKNALMYNFVIWMIVGIILIKVQISNPSLPLTLICIVLLLWMLLFTIFYTIKLEHFRTQILAVAE